MNKYITLPTGFIIDDNTTLKEKIIISEIHNLSSLEKGCIASNKHFEVLLGFSINSVSNTISSLVKKGILEVKISDRNHTRIIKIIDNYTLNLLYTKSVGVSTKSVGVSTKSVESKENNSFNNTVNKKTNKKNTVAPIEIINFYKKNISSKGEKIREVKSFNAMGLIADSLEKVLIGLKNYKHFLDAEEKQEKYFVALNNFVGDKIYLDYQKDLTPKNSNDDWSNHGKDYNDAKEWK